MNQQVKNKLILALLLLTPIFVMIAATITYKVGYVPETKKNHGALLKPPIEIQSLALKTAAGEIYDYVADNKEYGRWHIFLFGDSQCLAESCQKMLWETRQLHVALAHRAHYVKRYYVSVGEPIVESLAAQFAKEHTRLQWLYLDKDSYNNFVTGHGQSFNPLQYHQFVLVDPNAWMMMYYDLKQHNGHDVITDLKYLLKKKGK